MSNLRLVGVWLLLALLMSANGIFREFVLRSATGGAQAEVASAIVGMVIILVTTRHFFRPLAHRPLSELARVSTVLTILTVAFEFLFGRYGDGKSWEELIANHAFWRGRLWPLVLLIVALTPFIWGRWWPRRVEHSQLAATFFLGMMPRYGRWSRASSATTCIRAASNEKHQATPTLHAKEHRGARVVVSASRVGVLGVVSDTMSARYSRTTSPLTLASEDATTNRAPQSEASTR